MNELIFAQLYYKELDEKLLSEESIRQQEEKMKRANLFSLNKRFNK